jgi:hypothetical protein
MIRAHQPGSQRSDPKSGGAANSSRSFASAERTCQGLSFHSQGQSRKTSCEHIESDLPP